MSNAPFKVGKTRLYNDYYLRGSLSDHQAAKILSIYESGAVPSLYHVIDGYKLHDPQTIAVAASIYNPRFFFADRVGLGKGLMAAARYAFLKQLYAKKAAEGECEPLKKQLLVTKMSNVLPMARMYAKYGQNIYPIYGTKAQTQIKYLDLDDPEIDGIVVPWSAFASHKILAFISDNLERFEFGVFDETEKLVKEGSQTYTMAETISRTMKWMAFTYGTPWQKSVLDYYYQFKVLDPKVMPYKNFLLENYAEFEDQSFFRTRVANDGSGYGFQRVKTTVPTVVGYKNQSDLKSRMALYFLARSKQDYADYLPEHSYIAVPVTMSDVQMKTVHRYTEKAVFLNSPNTCDDDFIFNEQNCPKLEKLAELCEEIKDSRPLIYCHNVKAQYTIQETLQKRGFKVEIINGRVPADRRDDVLQQFERNELDAMILNVYDALNIPNSDAIIFYTIPTLPHITYQVMGRIDRNNYTKNKSYYFMMYLDSIEIQRLRDLCLFREHHANEFTGSQEEVFSQLNKQIEAYEIPGDMYEEENDMVWEEEDIGF